MASAVTSECRQMGLMRIKILPCPIPRVELTTEIISVNGVASSRAFVASHSRVTGRCPTLKWFDDFIDELIIYGYGDRGSLTQETDET
ncbi:unnamed protein product [Caenorhabditis auriculariae]|uniref:Uncharacterized protein n=1 Tax=Caenorhabditis auriculariae TaxID=2777116 RepID=A0A8S1GQI1_9PELO|nr:unnamed protein product [Caenorhabditis auriculariae]